MACRAHNAVGKSGEWHALKVYRSGAFEGSDEHPFASEEHRFQISVVFDVVFDSGSECHDAASIHS